MRLEALGFSQVYDYVAGKTDWTAAGLPTEGELAGIPRAGAAISEAATCLVDDPLSVAREALREAQRCIVLDANDVVMGELRRSDVPDVDGGTCGEHARPGPTTIRANEDLHELLERMGRASVTSVIVTTPEGRLLGMLERDRATEVLHAWHSEHHGAHDDEDTGG